MFNKLTLLAALLLTSTANALVITVEDANVDVSNCIPFGCPGKYDPVMTQVYRDIQGFSLNAGDTIAFDLSGTNDVDLIFNIYLATASSNGSNFADSNGYTQVVAAGNGGRGTAAQGDYELQYTIDSSFSFGGGGLLIAFETVGATQGDSSWSTGFFGNPSANDTHVGQFYNGSAPGTGSYRTSMIPNFQLTIAESVPEPTTIGLFGVAMLLIVAKSRRLA